MLYPLLYNGPEPSISFNMPRRVTFDRGPAFKKPYAFVMVAEAEWLMQRYGRHLFAWGALDSITPATAEPIGDLGAKRQSELAYRTEKKAKAK